MNDSNNMNFIESNSDSQNKFKGEITLLSFSKDPVDFGLRYISSVLKENGYDVKNIFLRIRMRNDIPLKVVEQINCIAANSIFIGVTMMTEQVLIAKDFAIKMKQMNKGMILVGGGIHPSVKPEEILDVYDFAVRGEAEEIIVTLAHELSVGKTVENIEIPAICSKNYSSKEFGIIENINTLPFPDFSNGYVLEKDIIRPQSTFNELFGTCYRMLTTRGCPYACTYCVNDFYKSKAKHKFFRKRNVDNYIAELRFAKDKYGIEHLAVESDSFLSLSEKEMDDFVRLYKDIALPFHCSCTPRDIKEDRAKKMVDLGLVGIKIGIQSGSEDTLQLYKRTIGKYQDVINAANILHKFYPDLSVTYDIITDNPYEKDRDMNDTISLLEKLPKPLHLHVYSLTFYPGTYLYDKAVIDGFVKESYYLTEYKFLYKLNKSFYNFIFLLYSLRFPSRVIAWAMQFESPKNMLTRGTKSLFAQATNILLAMMLLRNIFEAIGRGDKKLIAHFLGLGLASVRIIWKK